MRTGRERESRWLRESKHGGDLYSIPCSFYLFQNEAAHQVHKVWFACVWTKVGRRENGIGGVGWDGESRSRQGGIRAPSVCVLKHIIIVIIIIIMLIIREGGRNWTQSQPRTNHLVVVVVVVDSSATATPGPPLLPPPLLLLPPSSSDALVRLVWTERWGRTTTNQANLPLLSPSPGSAACLFSPPPPAYHTALDGVSVHKIIPILWTEKSSIDHLVTFSHPSIH